MKGVGCNSRLQLCEVRNTDHHAYDKTKGGSATVLHACTIDRSTRLGNQKFSTRCRNLRLLIRLPSHVLTKETTCVLSSAIWYFFTFFSQRCHTSFASKTKPLTERCFHSGHVWALTVGTLDGIFGMKYTHNVERAMRVQSRTSLRTRLQRRLQTYTVVSSDQFSFSN